MVSHILSDRPAAHRTGQYMRRFTRLTNAFSKKVENYAHAAARI
jgi:hypothetical protein